jgi:outer membrane protein
VNKIKPLALSVCLAASVSAAHAEGKFTLGAGVGIVENPYKQYDADVFPSRQLAMRATAFGFTASVAATICGMTTPISCP